jgi:hypothetical protein
MGEPTAFIDSTAQATRAGEVPNASFTNGMNLGGSNACGIGINMNGGAVVGTPGQYTLLDQFGSPRTAQISQHIGGSGLGEGTEGTAPDAVIRFGTPSPDGDGSLTFIGNASLYTLGAGWATNV